MDVIETVADIKKLRQDWQGQEVGFVPTMGALHRGHLALVERAERENTRTVASIFVNPTQFNDPNDLQNYPQPREHDLALLKECGVSAVFLPTAREIYQDLKHFTVHEHNLSQVLCGPGRPGHFDGVLTVVLKLFGIVAPTAAYFGEKDFQQLRLIQEMTSAFFLNVKIVPCPTVREEDGLAMSSRNLRLTPEERRLAPMIYKVLTTAKTAADANRQLSTAGFKVEYLEEHWGRRFVAAHLGSVRLIDNVAI